MPINSRRKGSTAERAVCKILAEHFPQHKFERRSLGIQGCDVVASDGFPWAAEIKHDTRLKGIHLLVGNWLVRQFWLQAKTQAVRAEKKPLLVCKVEGYWMCTIDGILWQLFEDWCTTRVIKKESMGIAV